MKLYVSGPMTGYEEHNFPAFHKASEQLESKGYEVMSPARHAANDPSMTWADYLRRDLADLLEVDAVALLSGWEQSKGALLEVHVARELGMPCREIEEWLVS